MVDIEKVLGTLSPKQLSDLTLSMAEQALDLSKERLLALPEDEIIAALKSPEFQNESREAWLRISDSRILAWLSAEGVL